MMTDQKAKNKGSAGGFPQPVPPPGVMQHPPPVLGYATEEGRLERKDRLPCYGIGFGWVLFILGFIFSAIPWLVGALLFLFRRHKMDDREKPGYISCAIAVAVCTMIIIYVALAGTFNN